MLSNQLKRHRIIMPSTFETYKPVSETMETRSASKSQIAVLILARFTLLGILAYAAWRFGSVHSMTLNHVAISLVAVLSLSLVAFTCFRWKPKLPSLAIVVLPLGFIGYSVIQCLPLPQQLGPSLFHANAIRLELGEIPAEQLARRASELGAPAFPPASAIFASVIPQDSKIALVPLMLAAVICLLASLLFNTEKSRTYFLWFILLHSSALSLWGIVQRSEGAVDILPGVANTTRGLPFSSFYYRNAGAAAILPGVAAAAALFYISRSTPRSRSSAKSRAGVYGNQHYDDHPQIWSVKDLSLVTLGCVIVVGVVAALSRGAWVAGILALLIVGFSLRRELQFGKGGLVLGVFLSILTIATAQISHQIEAKLNRMTLADFTFNERWDHWKNGASTALSYFPFGSGLGTYGYATLRDQVVPTNVWFREAHNQYLQVFTESGIVGLALLLGVICWAMHGVVLLLTRANSAEDRAFGIFGLVVLVCAIVHSAVDFVIAIPANLFVYACFLGILGGLAKSVHRRQSHYHSKASYRASAIAIFASCAILGCYSVKYSGLEMVGDRAIDSTTIADLKDPLSEDVIAERIAILDHAIELQPDRAALYRHRAMYQFARYRAAVIEAGSKAGESIAWENTQPDVIYGIVASLDPATRSATINSLVSEVSMQTPLGLTLLDIATGLRNNPLFGQLHLTAAVLSPLGGWDADTWIEHAATLSKSDPDKLYASGLYAYYSQNAEQMTASWAECLAVTHKYDKSIIDLGLKRLEPAEFAIALVPPAKPEMLITLVRTVLQPDRKPEPYTDQDGRNLAREITDYLLVDSRIPEARRHAVAASIFEMAKDNEASKDQWLAAVESSPKDSNYRFHAAESLRATGSLQEALRHVVLGSTLAPEDVRFNQLATRIRSEIAKSSQ